MTDQCKAHTISGGRCELEQGHEQKHKLVRPTWSYEWTDESESTVADRYMNSRRAGA